MDFTGATTLMGTFKTFAEYAGAVICLGCLIFAGIRIMTGRFQDAIPALFGAAVLGWGAGWISYSAAYLEAPVRAPSRYASTWKRTATRSSRSADRSA